jgi:hypothetical protein
MTLPPRDLIDRDLEQIAEPVLRAQVLAGDTLNDLPIVCQSILASRQAAVLSVLVASHAWESSRGASLPFRAAVSPARSPEPDVPVPEHPALHELIQLRYVASVSVCVAHGEEIRSPRYR